MNPTNCPASDNQTVGVHISHPYSTQGPTMGNLAYQPLFVQPNGFNAYHFGGQSSVTPRPFESGSFQFASNGDPQIYTSAPLFALPSTLMSSIPTHLSGQHHLSQPHGYPTSTKIPATPPSSQSQSSNLYSDQSTKSMSHVPETSVKTTIIVSPTESLVKNANSDSGQSVNNPPVSRNRPGRAGALKCARCRRQKRGSKVSALRIVKLTCVGSLHHRPSRS
jgi:hypothetical protein